MIDWNTLIKPENSEQIPGNEAECRNKTGFVGTENADCRNSESKNSCGYADFVPTVPTVPTTFEGGRKGKGNHAPSEGVASENNCATKTHPINPIAICLLLSCCNKATFTQKETLEAIINLQTIPQSEQIRSWALLCQKHGIDPHRVIYPFTDSPNKGTSCQGCKHIEMEKISTSKRSVYRFICSQQHQILEAYYIHERVLIAPESCRDYLPTA
ncbi:MAG: hypothetical protein V9E86_02880 [Nitrosomonas sp.]